MLHGRLSLEAEKKIANASLHLCYYFKVAESNDGRKTTSNPRDMP